MFVTLRNITFSNNPDVSILCVFNISFAAIDWQISRWLFVNKANVAPQPAFYQTQYALVTNLAVKR
ncbi:MAG: hypothetical protein ACRDAP_05990 [Shewanella sp.]